MLTAFLIESYKNLQEDPQQVAIGILQQISSQTSSCTVPSSLLSSTTSSTGATSGFTPQVAAERVNICWFASLVLSISAASFGILVKQWLREYLSIDNYRPDERFRIRYHRSQGLKSWKLFEIAAILPLILQLSLALFFVGLCFFTASVHHSIGTTSLVLVSGWATFFIFALLAPILSSRCPYKTTYLKTPLRLVRLHVLPPVAYCIFVTVFCAMWLVALPWSMMAVIINCSWDSWSEPEFPRLRALEAAIHVARSGSDEESEISIDATNDIAIFAIVDSLFRNDELLPTMQAALYQTQATSREEQGSRTAFNLALEVARRRLKLGKEYGQSFSWEKLLPLDLPHGARTAVLNMAADEYFHLQGLPGNNMLKVEKACWLLVSGLMGSDSGSVPPRVISAIDHVLNSVYSRTTFMGCTLRRPQDPPDKTRGLLKVLTNINAVIHTIDTDSSVVYPLYAFFQGYFWKDSSRDLVSTSRLHGEVLSRLQWNMLASETVSHRSLITLVNLAVMAVNAACQRRRGAGQSQSMPSGEVELVEFVLDGVGINDGYRSYIEDCNRRYNANLSIDSGIDLRPGVTTMCLQLFRPETLPQFMDSILTRSNFLWSETILNILMKSLGPFFNTFNPQDGTDIATGKSRNFRLLSCFLLAQIRSS